MNHIKWCESCGKAGSLKSDESGEHTIDQHTFQDPTLCHQMIACDECELVYYCGTQHKKAHKEKHRPLCEAYQQYKKTETLKPEKINEEFKTIEVRTVRGIEMDDEEKVKQYGEKERIQAIEKQMEIVNFLIAEDEKRLASRELKMLLEMWQDRELFPMLAELEDAQTAATLEQAKKSKDPQPVMIEETPEQTAASAVKSKNMGSICFEISKIHWKLYATSMLKGDTRYYTIFNQAGTTQAQKNEMQHYQRYRKGIWQKDKEEAMNAAVDGAKMNPDKIPIDMGLDICHLLKKDKHSIGMISILEPILEALRYAIKNGQFPENSHQIIIKHGVKDSKQVKELLMKRLQTTHDLLFEAYFPCGKLKKAKMQADCLLEIDANSAVGHSHLGKIQVELAKIQEAEAYYRKAIECDPTFASAHLHLAQILADTPKKMNEAITHCEACIAQVKEDKEILQPAYILLATIYMMKKDMNATGRTLMKGLSQYPASGILLMHLGVFFIQNRKFKQGMHSLKKALQPSAGLESFLSYIYIMKHLTIAAIKEGLFREAEETLCQLLMKDPYNEFGCFFYDHLRMYLNALKLHVPYSWNGNISQLTTLLHSLNERKHEFYLSHILDMYLQMYPLSIGKGTTRVGMKLNSKVEFYENMNVHDEWTEIFWNDYAIRHSTDAILTYNLMKKWHKHEEHALKDDDSPASLEELEEHIAAKIRLGRTVLPIIEMGREYMIVSKKLKMSIVSGPQPPACVDSAFWCIPLLHTPTFCIVCGEVESIHGNLTPCASCESVYFCSDQCYEYDAKQPYHQCKKAPYKNTSHTLSNYKSFMDKIQKEKKDFIESYTTDCFAINGRGAVVVDKTTMTLYPTDRMTAVRYYTLAEVSKFAVTPKLLKPALKHIQNYNPKHQYVAIYHYGGMFQVDVFDYPSYVATQSKHESTISSKKQKLMKALINSDLQSKRKKKKKKNKKKKSSVVEVEANPIVNESNVKKVEETSPVIETVAEKETTSSDEEDFETQQILDSLIMDFSSNMEIDVIKLVFEQSKDKHYETVYRTLEQMSKPSKPSKYSMREAKKKKSHKKQKRSSPKMKKHSPKHSLKQSQKQTTKATPQKKIQKQSSKQQNTTQNEKAVTMTWGNEQVVLLPKGAKETKQETPTKATSTSKKTPKSTTSKTPNNTPNNTPNKSPNKTPKQQNKTPSEEEKTKQTVKPEKSENGKLDVEDIIDSHSSFSNSSDEYMDAIEIDESHPSPFDDIPIEAADMKKEAKQSVYSYMPPGMVPHPPEMMQGFEGVYPMVMPHPPYFMPQPVPAHRICIYFNSPGGCMRGDSCKFQHIPFYPYHHPQNFESATTPSPSSATSSS